MDGQTKAVDASLERFAAGALDWPAVRELYSAFAPSSLGRRALLGLAPRGEADAAEALGRAAEAQTLLGRDEGPPLGGNPDPLPALGDARRYGRSLSGEDLAGVARFLRIADDVAAWMAARRGEMPRCAGLFVGLPDTLPLRRRIEAVVDDRGEVTDGASPLLADLRREIARLRSGVEERVKALAGSASLRNALADGHAGRVHRRGGRACLAVRTKGRGRVPGIVHDRSQSGETLFVEPEDVVEAGNRLELAQSDSEREVARILIELTREVLGRLGALERLAEALAQLELAVISAGYALSVGGRPARLPGADGGGDGLVLRALRHPLLVEQERRGRIERVVPIDLRLGADFDMLVITGPNTGGKTLALKSAGLAALVTRLGLALPCAEGTTVPLYDGVVADIGDEQEIQQSLSTFSSHLTRIRSGLERAGPSTLVLLDELGGGTDPAEGAALGEAILAALCERAAPTLASTHLGQLKEFAFRHPRVENACVEFDLDSLAPLFRVLVGTPGESRALAIARRLGLPEPILARAQQRLERPPEETERLLEDLRGARSAAERVRSSAEERLEDLEGRLREIEAERDELARRGDQLEAEAQRGLEERVARARPWLDRARATLAQIARGQRETMEEALCGLEGAIGDAAMTDRRRAFLEGLRKGDLVWLPRFKKRCPVARIHKARREITVRLGRRDLTVAFDDVTFYESL